MFWWLWSREEAPFRSADDTLWREADSILEIIEQILKGYFRYLRTVLVPWYLQKIGSFQDYQTDQQGRSRNKLLSSDKLHVSRSHSRAYLSQGQIDRMRGNMEDPSHRLMFVLNIKLSNILTFPSSAQTSDIHKQSLKRAPMGLSKLATLLAWQQGFLTNSQGWQRR